jgi:hypothetical protein
MNGGMGDGGGGTVPGGRWAAVGGACLKSVGGAPPGYGKLAVGASDWSKEPACGAASSVVPSSKQKF